MSLYRHNPQVLFLPTPDRHIISPEIAFSFESEIIFDLTIIDLHRPQSPGSKKFLQIVDLDVQKKIQVLSKCDESECSISLPPLYQDKTHNLQGRGILGNVAVEKADVGLGALYLWYHEYKFLDFSVAYIRTGITCLAPRPELLSNLLLPIRPFNIFTWLIVLCAVLVASVALYYIKKLEISFLKNCHKKRKEKNYKWFTTKEDTLLRTLGFLVLQASSNRTVEKGSVRHLVNWLHVAFLLVATSYSSGLASILTVPSYLPPIDTVSDLVNRELQWGATHDAWIFSLREATETQMHTLVSRFRALTKEQLYYNSLTASFAFSVERLPAGHFAVGDYITEESMKHLRLMKQDIYYEHCIFVFQKGSPYLQSFNHLIHRLLDSGLLLYWEGEVARRFLNSRVQSAVKESASVGMQHHAHVAPTPINLGHMEGAFIILGVGVTMSILTFLAELYVGVRYDVYNKRRQAAARPSSKEPLCYGFHH
ncbi:uncharacterized protein LOC128983345 isoform X2 [Macrosteles quadrilineatus]|uniref:uncharacterized protein LOC128983345 isoform X2 n=1 Tax=Macrosteles quadrilineatus TaxID=74068 RepID=UPI0023E0AA02|nr:uncharacterized protein LOC128983345 isoform X2 [Macrosteles quadrilineatus]